MTFSPSCKELFPTTSIVILSFRPSAITSKLLISSFMSNVYSYIDGSNSGLNVYPFTSNFNKSELDTVVSLELFVSSDFSSSLVMLSYMFFDYHFLQLL